MLNCKNKCLFNACKNKCTIQTTHTEHLCDNSHDCEQICESGGYCVVENAIDIGNKKTQIGRKEKW